MIKLIRAAIAAAETESNYCLVLSAKNSSRRCRNWLSYSNAANADRAVLQLSQLSLQLKFSKFDLKVKGSSGFLRSGNRSSKRVLNRFGRCVHNTMADMTLPTFLVQGAKPLPRLSMALADRRKKTLAASSPKNSPT